MRDLGDPAEIIVGGRDPVCRGHVETQRLGEAVGVGNAARLRFHGSCTALTLSDAQCANKAAAVGVETHQSVPELLGLAGKVPGPALVPRLDRLGRGGIVEPRRLRGESRALDIDLEAGVDGVAVERFEAECVQHREEGGVGVARQRVPQRQRAMRRQFGDEPIGQWLDAIFLLGRFCAGADPAILSGVLPTMAGRSPSSPSEAGTSPAGSAGASSSGRT